MKKDKTAIDKVRHAIDVFETRGLKCESISKISNIRILSKCIKADITIWNGEDKRTYHDCEYPLTILDFQFPIRGYSFWFRNSSFKPKYDEFRCLFACLFANMTWKEFKDICQE